MVCSVCEKCFEAVIIYTLAARNNWSPYRPHFPLAVYKLIRQKMQIVVSVEKQNAFCPEDRKHTNCYKALTYWFLSCSCTHRINGILLLKCESSERSTLI